MSAGRIRVGIAGWTFPPWRGAFYPPKLKQKEELAHAARQFPALEVNGTFYSLQQPKTFAAWHAETPEDFIFTLKAPRYITHMKRLKECEAPLANFLASGPLRLGPKFGPILWQLPPNLAFEAERLDAFLALLPRDRRDAATLAAKHEDRMAGKTWLEPGEDGPVHHAVEGRHPSFGTPECLALFRKHGVSLVETDGIPDHPQIREATGPIRYARLHLRPELGPAGYGAAAIAEWAARCRDWAAEGRDVFVIFDAAGDESVKLHTPTNAAALLAKLAEG